MVISSRHWSKSSRRRQFVVNGCRLIVQMLHVMRSRWRKVLCVRMNMWSRVVWRWWTQSTTHYVISAGAMGTWTGLRCVGESQPRRINDPITANEGNGNLSWLTNPQPLATKSGDVRHYAQHTFLASEHSFSFDVTKPNSQIGWKVFSG